MTTEDRTAFQVPAGTSGNPFRYVPIAANAASPGGATTGWSQVTLPYATNATHISATVPPSGNKFYRLRKPQDFRPLNAGVVFAAGGLMRWNEGDLRFMARHRADQRCFR